ncbi:MAG: hypothetical protein JWM78_2242 [Verrucomicrobiaceae bacterium]|nr:hypothetical protein [Verrucomicrobiaceae bacterium]
MTPRRILLITVAALVVIALIILSAIIAMLGSPRGTQWSLQLTQNYLPQLTFENTRGDWLHGLHIDTLQWRDDTIDLRISDLTLQLRWQSLLHSEINLSIFHASELRIEPKGESNNDPVKLPPLLLPITLSAPQFALQQLQIVNRDSSVVLDKISAGIRWSGTTLNARDLRFGWNQLQLHSSGELGFRGDYPLQLKGELTLPQWPTPIALTTGGDLRHLLIHATTPQPYALSSEIKLATLDPHLPLEINAVLTQPIVQPLPSGDIKFNTAKLNARGDLTRIDAALETAIEEPHYSVTQLTATAQWQPDQLQTAMRWSLNGGNLQLNCDATLNEPLHALCNGAATTIALTPWLTDQRGDVSSTIKLEGSWSAPQWSLALQLPDIRGKIGSDIISGQLDLGSADGAQWLLKKMELASGPNKVSAAGKFGTQNQLQLDLTAGNLGRIQPSLGGKLTANLLVTGDLPQPNLQGKWLGTQLHYNDTTLARSSGDITLQRLGIDASTANINLQDVVIAAQKPIDLTVAISGKREQQQLTLNAHQSAHRLQLQCNTRTAKNFLDWQIDCPDLSGSVHMRSIDENWRNTAAVNAHLQLESTVATATTPAHTDVADADIKPLCLRATDTELCLDKPLRYDHGKLQPLSAHGNALPLRWLSVWFPEELKLQNDARASLRVQLESVTPLRANANVTIATTKWEWATQTGNQTAEINAVTIDAKLDEQRAAMSASAQSPTLGSVNVQLNVLDPRNTRALDGHVALDKIQIAGFAWLVQGLDALSGEINGDIRIAGNASAPQLHGQLLLQNGAASWAPLGAPFHDIHADLTFDNNSAKLGGWFVLGQGGGDIDGNINWEGTGENWRAQLALVAGGLSAMPLPNSTVVFSPHIDLTAQPREIHVKGFVDIASAEITLKQLPPDTVDVSQDQQIVGQLPDTDATKLWAELALNLGDQFHFAGFGADVNLSGRLQITKAPGDALQMNGEVRVPRGRYRAYGQRLSIRKGSFIFYGPPDNPDLNLEAVREMPIGVTDVVGLRVIGSLKTPEALLFSEPSLADSDIAYYLLTGRKPTTNTGTTTNQYSASGALLSLGLAGSEGTAGKLAGKFGISDLQLGTSEDSSGNTEAEISGQLGQDLSVRYGRGIGQQSNSISFQYRLTPRLMIETISGIEDALDLLYSFEIK